MYFQAHITRNIYPIFFHRRNLTQAKRHAFDWSKSHHPNGGRGDWFSLSPTTHRCKVSDNVYLTVIALVDEQIPSWADDRIINPKRATA